MKQTRRHGSVPLVIAALLAAYMPLAAQTAGIQHYVREKWSSENGLPQNSVRAVLQTRDGYIWMATQEGAVRFDGVSFDVFDRKNTPAIPHQEVFDLAEGPDGTLWIATFGGLVSYRAGQFRLHPARLGRESDITRSLLVEPDGSVLIGTNAGGITRCQNGEVKPFALTRNRPALVVNAMIRDSRGRLLAGTTHGLHILGRETTTVLTERDGLPSDSINALLETKDGTVWLGTDRGLARLPAKEGSWLVTVPGLKEVPVQSLFEDRHGTLWIGTENRGIFQLADGVFQTISFRDGQSSDYVLDFMEDREGSIWAGTYFNGADRLWRGNFDSFDVPQGLANQQLRVIYQTRDGTVWLGGEMGLGKIRNGRYDDTITKLLPSSFVRAVFEDSAGNLWIGTRSGAVCWREGRCRILTVRDGLSENYVRAIAEDRDGTILLGTSGQGVDLYRQGRVENLESRGLPRDVIRCMFRDRQDRIWISGNTGLWMLRGGKLTAFGHADGLPPEPVYSCQEDDDGTLWFGTYGGGIFRFRDGRFKLLTVREGLFDNVAFQILGDRTGYFWISCNRGIYRVRRQDLHDVADGKTGKVNCRPFGLADGMLSVECNGNAQPAGWQMQDRRLWFPTTRGAVIIDPENLQENRLPPPVVIKEVLIDKQTMDVFQKGQAPPGSGQLEFRYAGLSFVAPARMNFRYQLVGFDPDWNGAGNRRTAYYTNIPPGEYTFRVIASNSDGLWNEEGASYHFSIAPRYYQAGWFLWLSGLILLLAAFGIYRWRIWALLQREQELKHRVEEALARIKILGGLIPICANCKKIRDDKGYWSHLETYIKQHSEATFSHGICPDCRITLYGDLLDPLETVEEKNGK